MWRRRCGVSASRRNGRAARQWRNRKISGRGSPREGQSRRSRRARRRRYRQGEGWGLLPSHFVRARNAQAKSYHPKAWRGSRGDVAEAKSDQPDRRTVPKRGELQARCGPSRLCRGQPDKTRCEETGVKRLRRFRTGRAERGHRRLELDMLACQVEVTRCSSVRVEAKTDSLWLSIFAKGWRRGSYALFFFFARNLVSAKKRG